MAVAPAIFLLCCSYVAAEAPRNFKADLGVGHGGFVDVKLTWDGMTCYTPRIKKATYTVTYTTHGADRKSGGSTKDTQMTISELEYWTMYNFTLYTKCWDEQGQAFACIETGPGNPHPVKHVTVSPNSTNAEIVWSPATDCPRVPDGYNITFCLKNSTSCKSRLVLRKINADMRTIIDDLDPATSYTVNVTAVIITKKNNYSSIAVESAFNTTELTFPRPEMFNDTFSLGKGDYNATITWELRTKLHVLQYNITLVDSDKNERIASATTNETEIAFSKLNFYSNLTIGVLPIVTYHRKLYHGDYTNFTIKVPSGVPTNFTAENGDSHGDTVDVKLKWDGLTCNLPSTKKPYYTVTYTTNGDDKKSAGGTTDTNMTIPKLEYWTMYNFTLSTKCLADQGDTITSLNTGPGRPHHVENVAVSPDSMSAEVSWSQAAAMPKSPDAYKVAVCLENTTNCISILVRRDVNSTMRATIDDLDPATNYTVKVSAVIITKEKNYTSLAESMSFNTPEIVCPRPVNFVLTFLPGKEDHKAIISWELKTKLSLVQYNITLVNCKNYTLFAETTTNQSSVEFTKLPLYANFTMAVLPILTYRRKQYHGDYTNFAFSVPGGSDLGTEDLPVWAIILIVCLGVATIIIGGVLFFYRKRISAARSDEDPLLRQDMLNDPAD